jgi:hypothetical protein
MTNHFKEQLAKSDCYQKALKHELQREGYDDI